jgi:hypothetical protein
MQNDLIERFNQTYRVEVLDTYVFDTLGQVRRMTDEWRSVTTSIDPTTRSAISRPDSI